MCYKKSRNASLIYIHITDFRFKNVVGFRVCAWSSVRFWYFFGPDLAQIQMAIFVA